MISREELVEKFLENKSYLENGAGFLSKRWGVNVKEVKIAKKLARIKIIEDEYETEDGRPFRRMFFDIETSPNQMFSWRSGYNLNLGPDNIIKERAIICICWKWENEDKVYHLQWDKDQCDRKMLEQFTDELSKADEVIGHNGDRYDIKWVRTRCLIHRIPFNATVKSLDTLKKARSAFNFNSNKLDYIGKVLGVGQKLETGGFDLWKRICLLNCKESMHKMVTYCKQDVILLEDVFQAMQSYIHQNSHVGVHQGGSKHSCPSCGSEQITLLSSPITKAGTIQRHIECNECKTDYKISNTNWKKYLKGK